MIDRGYYYDAETKLYYLQSRYYDPEIGRFINADTVDYADPGSVNGLNLYAYCVNNPVMYYDPSGTIAIFFGLELALWALVALGVITIGVVESQTHIIETPWKWAATI